MAKYIVQWKYTSGLGGPWQKGDEVNLEPLNAEAINRDSPGVLVEVKAEVEVKPETRQAEGPAQDRQVKRPAGKR